MQDRQGSDPTATPLSKVVQIILATHAAFDVRPASPGEMAEARMFAAAMIGSAIVNPETLAWVHARSGAGLFLAREEGRLTGVWAALLLTQAGVEACLADRFDGVDPDPAHVAEKGQEPAGIYAWGIAAATRDTAKRLMAASDAVDRAALAHLPGFTRPVTEAGLRLAVERKGFRPVEGSRTNLYWVDPRAARPGVAA